jgi:hypothetical protein
LLYSVGDYLLYLYLNPSRAVELASGFGKLLEGYLFARLEVYGEPHDGDAALAEEAMLLEALRAPIAILLLLLIRQHHLLAGLVRRLGPHHLLGTQGAALQVVLGDYVIVKITHMFGLGAKSLATRHATVILDAGPTLGVVLTHLLSTFHPCSLATLFH